MQIEIAVVIWFGLFCWMLKALAFGLFCWMLKALAFGLGEPDHGEE